MTSDKTRGLYRKYNVTRTDGKPVAESFVLNATDPLALQPLLLYARLAAGEGYKQLSEDIYVMAKRWQKKETITVPENNFPRFMDLLIKLDKQSQLDFTTDALIKYESFREIMLMPTTDRKGYAFVALEKPEYWHILIEILEKSGSPKPTIPAEYTGRLSLFVEIWKQWAIKCKYVTVKSNASVLWVEDKYGNKGNWS